MSTLTKVRASSAYKEGGPVILSPSPANPTIVDISYGLQNASGIFNVRDANLSKKFLYPLYYQEYPTTDVGSGNVASGLNANAVITYSGIANSQHVIAGLAWSYSNTPVNGALDMQDGSGNHVFSIDITEAGAGFFPFTPAGQRGTAGADLIVTLAAAGSGIVGKVNTVGYRLE